MAIYPMSAGDRRAAPNILQAVVAEIFTSCGMSSEDGALLARSLVHADCRGILSHGVLRVPDYVKKLTSDGVDPRGRPVVVSDRGAAIVVDSRNAMGQIGGTFAMRCAIARASEIGVAEIQVADLKARQLGIQAVPCFVFDGRYAVSGAQEPSAFLPLLDLAREHAVSAPLSERA